MRSWLVSVLALAVCVGWAVGCGDDDAAGKLTVDVPARPDAEAERWGLLGDWYYGRGQLDKALAAYARGGQSYNAGAVAQQLGDFDAAEAHYRAALRRGRTPAVLVALANLARARGRYREALAYLDDAGDGADVAIERGVVLGMIGKHGEADAAFAAALAADEANARAHLAYGPLLNERGDYAEALAHYERARALSAGDEASTARALIGAGYAHIGLGDIAAARPLLTRGLAIREQQSAPPALVAEARFGLALALRDADPARALELATAARADLDRAGEAGVRQRPDVDALIESLQ